MFTRMAAAVLALALVAAACGDDGGGGLSDAEEAIVGAIVAGMNEDSDPENPFADPVAARCMAVGMVEDLGMTRLAEVGITSDLDSPEAAFAAMSDDEIEGIIDIAFECIDLVDVMTEQFAVDGVSEASARCLATQLGETDFFRAAFRAGMTGDDTYDPTENPEFIVVMLEAFTECLTPDEMAGIMGG